MRKHVQLKQAELDQAENDCKLDIVVNSASGGWIGRIEGVPAILEFIKTGEKVHTLEMRFREAGVSNSVCVSLDSEQADELAEYLINWSTYVKGETK